MSFGWNCMFRKGSWLEFRRFVLLQRKNVPDRILSINQELSRIGRIVVSYEKVDGRVTEKRTGFYVDEKSALGKLIIAYIAQGGNLYVLVSRLLQDLKYRG
jgi:hypothetical protein